MDVSLLAMSAEEESPAHSPPDPEVKSNESNGNENLDSQRFDVTPTIQDQLERPKGGETEDQLSIDPPSGTDDDNAQSIASEVPSKQEAESVNNSVVEVDSDSYHKSIIPDNPSASVDSDIENQSVKAESAIDFSPLPTENGNQFDQITSNVDPIHPHIANGTQLLETECDSESPSTDIRNQSQQISSNASGSSTETENQLGQTEFNVDSQRSETDKKDQTAKTLNNPEPSSTKTEYQSEKTAPKPVLAAPPERTLLFDRNGLTELQSDATPHKRSSTKFGKKNRNMNRSRLYHSLTSLEKKGKLWSKFYNDEEPNVKKVLEAVKEDQTVITDPADNKKRRSVLVNRKANEKFGFTIQSYTFMKFGSEGMEQVTFVDYVELNSPGYFAGLRAGDVILSINGMRLNNQMHESLVTYIAGCLQMRMVVLFENCVQKIELCSRSIKLRKLLMDKELELKILNLQEERLSNGQPLLSTGDLASHFHGSNGSLHSSASLDSLQLNHMDWRSPSSILETDDEDIWEGEDPLQIDETPDSADSESGRISKHSGTTSSSNFSSKRQEEEETEEDFQVIRF